MTQTLWMTRYQTFSNAYPATRLVEGQYGLPDGLLFAVGWRETRLVNELGDGGHGHGVWQLDDRSHRIPTGFDGDVHAQAVTAAAMLRSLLSYYRGAVPTAAAAYNAGVGAVDAALARGHHPDTVTTGFDYGTDVYGLLVAFHAAHLQLRAGTA